MISPEVIRLFADGGKPPRILVVTDMSFSSPPVRFAPGFSLVQFVKTLEQDGAVFGQKPIVTKANMLPVGADPAADIQGFTFDRLVKSEYDVCFIFTFEIDKPRQFELGQPPRRQLGLPDLKDNERAAIKKFMEEGGGVFATGDHEDLGARTAKDIPRVRNMRKWFWDPNDPENPANAPSGRGTSRLSTNLPGDDEQYEFDDQSDRHPQRLFLNRRTNAGGFNNAHPLMQVRDSDGSIKAIVHIPDHPHEGECIIPSTEKLQDRTEWPLELGGNEPISPEIVAKSMSYGGVLIDNGKAPLEPREFIAIAAYDGHRAGVGRVITDATWHHFIDINIDGTGSDPLIDGTPRTAFIPQPNENLKQGERELIAEQWSRLQQHWRNLAEWLMPPQARRRHAAAVHIAAAEKSILMDELMSLTPDQLGGKIKTNLDRQLLPYQVNDLVETVLAMGISDPAARKEVTPKQTTAALGAFAAALANQKAEDTDEVILANLAEAVKARLQQP